MRARVRVAAVNSRKGARTGTLCGHKRATRASSAKAHLLHVEVDAVEDGALVDDEHRQLLEDLGKLLDGLRDARDLLVALLRHGLEVVHDLSNTKGHGGTTTGSVTNVATPLNSKEEPHPRLDQPRRKSCCPKNLKNCSESRPDLTCSCCCVKPIWICDVDWPFFFLPSALRNSSSDAPAAPNRWPCSFTMYSFCRPRNRELRSCSFLARLI